jgi:hypothetical protein
MTANSVAASQARVFQFASKLEVVRQRVVHVAPSWRLRRIEAKDGRVNAMDCFRPFDPKISVFYVLGTGGISVFCLGL